ncbi:MAG: hypothetical protein E7409_03840 [Ruminococcaceae bacterium]|nr:hypothetical protein [Oscillospiraceae bacterium]
MVMKKLTSILVAALMIITCMAPVTGFAAESTVLFSEGFNASATYGNAPSVIAVDGGSGNGVIDLGEENKAFSIGLDHTVANISFAASPSSGVVWYGMRFRVNGTLEGGAMFQLIDSAGAKTNLINISNNGASLYDGKYFGKVQKNIWSDMHVKIDYTNKLYSVYVNGECVQKDWKITGTVPTAARIGFEFINNASIGSVEIDHIVAYRDNKVMTKYPKQEFNPEVAEVEEGSAEKVKRLYVFDDFNYLGGLDCTYISTVPGKGVIGTRSQKGMSYYTEGDRMYLHMEVDAGIANAPHFDVVMKRFNSTQYVIDMMLNIFQLDSRIFQMGLQKGYNSGSKWLMAAETNGVIRCGGDVFNELTYNRWTRVSFAIDATKSTFDVYIDGVLVREGCTITGNARDIDRISVDFSAGSGAASLGIDALAIYEGTELMPSLEQKDYTGYFVNSYEWDDQEVNAWIGNKAIYCNTNSAFYKEGVKKEYDGENEKYGYVTIEGTPMGIVKTMAEAYGLTADYNEETQIVTLSDGTTMKVGDNVFIKDGKEISAGGNIEFKNGEVFAPLRPFFEKIHGKTTTYESTWELLFITEDGTSVDTTNAEMMKMIMHLMIFRRMSGEEALATIQERWPNQQHPRLCATEEAVAQVRKNIETDENAKKLYEYLRATCDGVLSAQPNQWRDLGNGRLDMVRTTEDRLSNLGYMYHISGDERYAERAMVEIDDILTRPYFADAHPLNRAAIMGGLSRCYDLFFDHLGEERRAKIRKIVKGLWEDVLFDGSDATAMRAHTWMRTGDNFGSVHNGTYLESTLTFMDHPEMQEYGTLLFEQMLRHHEYATQDYAPDGAWPEGVGYWKYTMLEWAPATMSLRSVLGDTMGREDHLGLRNAGYFLVDVTGMAHANLFHDSGTGAKQYSRKDVVEQSHAHFALSTLYQDPNILNAWMGFIDNFLYNNEGTSLMWYNPNLQGGDDGALDHRYRGELDMVALRSSWEDENAMLLTAHSGQNYMSHSHIDGGTYVMDAMGYSWVIDVGTEDYSNPYSPVEGNFYVTRPEAHNVYLINPRAGYQGQDLYEKSATTMFETSDREGFAVVNMQPYYKEDVITAQRGFKMADDRRHLIVRDEMVLKNASEVYSFIHTKANIEIIDNNTAIFEQFGKKMLVEVFTNGRDLTIEEMECEILPVYNKPKQPRARDMSEYRKLGIKLNANGSLNITVKYTPLYEDITETEYEDEMLALWKCAEGELQLPRLTDVLVDGVSAERFNPLNSQVTVTLPAKTTKVPVITATADEKYNVEVRQNASDTLMDDVIIKVSEKANPDNAWYYTVRFDLTQYGIESLDGLKLANIQSIIEEDTGAVIMDPLTDRNFATERYESLGGFDYLIDLGSVQELDSIVTAWGYIKDQKYYFDVAYSEDGENWELKTCHISAGTEGYERLHLDEGAHARYIRISPNGRIGGMVSRLNEVAIVVK